MTHQDTAGELSCLEVPGFLGSEKKNGTWCRSGQALLTLLVIRSDGMA
jgi:hypothetical protein